MRLIDADAAVKVLERIADKYRNAGLHESAMDFAGDACMLRDPACFPTVDAVEVVRCKDCKRRGTSYECPFRRLIFTEAEGYHYEDVTLDDSFCSFGERKEAEA